MALPQKCFVSRPRVLLIHSRLQPVVGDSVLQWKPFKTVSRMRMRFSTWLKPGVNETVLGQSCLEFVIEGRSFIGRERNETRGAGDSIKPGVERSATPGWPWERDRARGVSDSLLSFAAAARSAGSIVGGLDPGAYAPGFMMSRAPRAGPAILFPQVCWSDSVLGIEPLVIM